MPGLFKGVKPLTRIKKEDRLETALGPIVNSRKLYIRRNMTDMVDEFFEHPVARHDDLMDALYYADYFAKPPKSSRMTREQWEKEITKKSRPFIGYNWLTGGRI